VIEDSVQDIALDTNLPDVYIIAYEAVRRQGKSYAAFWERGYDFR
jgi:hypothetical protein